MPAFSRSAANSSRSASISAAMWWVIGAGVAADADAAVEGGVAEPHRPLFLALLQHLPEPHMMAAIGAATVRLLEREVLAAAEIVQVADRRVAIGPVQQHAAGDFDRRSQRDRIGGIPAGGVHGADHVPGVADQSDIDRIAGNALPGPRHHRQCREPLLVFVMGPQRRQHDIGEQAVDAGKQQQQQRGALQAPVSWRGRQVARHRGRSQSGAPRSGDGEG